ncbi:hypothetical protein Tco_1278658 [Tanacetum coccineum]
MDCESGAFKQMKKLIAAHTNRTYGKGGTYCLPCGSKRGRGAVLMTEKEAEQIPFYFVCLTRSRGKLSERSRMSSRALQGPEGFGLIESCDFVFLSEYGFSCECLGDDNDDGILVVSFVGDSHRLIV